MGSLLSQIEHLQYSTYTMYFTGKKHSHVQLLASRYLTLIGLLTLRHYHLLLLLGWRRYTDFGPLICCLPAFCGLRSFCY